MNHIAALAKSYLPTVEWWAIEIISGPKPKTRLDETRIIMHAAKVGWIEAVKLLWPILKFNALRVLENNPTNLRLIEFISENAAPGGFWNTSNNGRNALETLAYTQACNARAILATELMESFGMAVLARKRLESDTFRFIRMDYFELPDFIIAKMNDNIKTRGSIRELKFYYTKWIRLIAMKPDLAIDSEPNLISFATQNNNRKVLKFLYRLDPSAFMAELNGLTEMDLKMPVWLTIYHQRHTNKKARALLEELKARHR